VNNTDNGNYSLRVNLDMIRQLLHF